MEHTNALNFIVVDDDPINNLICRRYIQLVFPKAEIHTFTDPNAGFEYIATRYLHTANNETVLFLDINMPVVSGWVFLERFEKLSEDIKRQIRIFVLSSSIAFEDKVKADSNELILGFIEKPLTYSHVKELAATTGV